jgi:hypothetical protein
VIRQLAHTFPLIFILSSTIYSQDWFPLEVGNRWDYFVRHDAGANAEWYDTLSIEIIEKQTLPNALEYFVLSEPFPFWNNFFATKYVREEYNNVYFFDIEDSIDCFAFRFDIPQDSSYINCKREMHILSIDTSYTLGVPDYHQTQTPYDYWFSYNFGIYSYFEWGIIEYSYGLKGCIISGVTYGELLVSVRKEAKNPKTISLCQNYPNPFNPTTTIKYQIPEISFVTIKVYDILGNEIATLVSEEKPAGSYDVEFIGDELPSGIYFYQLEAGNFIETKKMVLLK